MKIPYRKVQYYLLFTYYKFRILIDCKKGRARLILAEIIHLTNSLLGTSFEMPQHDRIGWLETIFGKYKFIADNYGYSILSPAFERPDLELFIRQVQSCLKMKKRVLFLDIGANVGLYSIGVNGHINDKHLTTIAFEPDPVYEQLLRENIKENNIARMIIHHVALGSKNQKLKREGFTRHGEKVSFGKVIFGMKRLDSILRKQYYKQFDEIFVKIDIEGHEEDAISGAKYLWQSGIKINLMIEDCVNPSIIQYLQGHNFRFSKKITPYNSFWTLN